MSNPTLQIRLSTETIERFERAAAASGLTLNNWIRMELWRASAPHAAPTAPGLANLPRPKSAARKIEEAAQARANAMRTPAAAPTSNPAPTSETERLLRQGMRISEIAKRSLQTPPMLARLFEGQPRSYSAEDDDENT